MMATAKTEYRIDLANVTDGEALHDALAAALPLPEYYGRNLDAFYDVLTEFGGSWRIVFRNADSVCQAFRTLCAEIGAFIDDSEFKGGFDEYAVFAASEAYAATPVKGNALAIRDAFARAEDGEGTD